MTQALEASVPPLDSHTDVIRVAGTRVSLETLVTAFDSGATAEEIVQQYPTLDLAQVYAVISYLLSNRASVDEYLRTRTAEAEALRSRLERRSPAQGIRARLLARRSADRLA